MTVLVTGGSGYVGGRLLQRLQADAVDARVVGREPTQRLRLEPVVLDLATATPEHLDQACEGIESIVHLAGENEVDAAREPAAALASTVVATERLAEAAVRMGVKRIVYMSTVHVYGERMTEGATLTEDLRPEPRASYAISRLASEHALAGLATKGFDLVVFRLTNSVGAPDHPEVDRWTLVANDLCRQGATLGRLELRTSGAQWRDFVSLDDVCAAVAKACRLGPEAIEAGTYNLASGRPNTVRGIAEMIQASFEEATGALPELHAPPLPAERPDPYHVSVERLRAVGLSTDTRLEDSVAETVRFCIRHRKELV